MDKAGLAICAIAPHMASIGPFYAPAAVVRLNFRRHDMTDHTGATAPLNPVVVAKKYRISVEDAKAIIDQHGDDAKAIHKAARRLAA